MHAFRSSGCGQTHSRIIIHNNHNNHNNKASIPSVPTLFVASPFLMDLSNVSVSFGTRALFKWKGKSCPDCEAFSCSLEHGDLLVMDGQCQDEFLHCTDSGLEQERINVPFRWIKQHVASCRHLRTGVVCCLPACAQGLSVSVTEFVLVWRCLGLLGAPENPVHGESSPDNPNMLLLEVAICANLSEIGQSPWLWCMYGKLGSRSSPGNCRQKQCKTSFCRNSLERFWRVIIWYLWIGRARRPGPGPPGCCS